MTIKALRVEPKDIPYIWHDVKPLIDKVLCQTNGEMLSEDCLKLLLNRSQILFVGGDIEKDEIQSALVAEIIKYPRKKVFRIITWSTKSGHDYELWMDLFDTIEDYAKLQNCNLIEAWTRKGLARKIKWDNEYSIITKHI
tara:strand:+ start:283 stop:702 length:420 start_codon:yes stop_codon:yes gene_type:complete